MSSQGDDFGDFGDFGDFSAPAPQDDAQAGAIPVETAHPASTAAPASEPTHGANDDGDDGDGDGDDFGDFGDFDASVSVPAPAPAPAQIDASKSNAGDSDFGDFGDFDEPVPAPAPTSAPEPAANSATVAAPPIPIAAVPVQANPEEEERIRRALMPDNTDAVLPVYYTVLEKLKNCFPIEIPIQHYGRETAEPLVVIEVIESQTPRTSTTQQNTPSKSVVPSAAFESELWYDLWGQLSSETVYSESMASKFRWRKSTVRKEFLNALGVKVVEEPNQNSMSTTTLPLEQSQSSLNDPMAPRSSQHVSKKTSIAALSSSILPSGPLSGDSRESDLMEAKRLCDITEDDMRRKTNEELNQLVAQLSAYHQKMQEQANYWLDAKEQLVMDAEMHNKMIASLVQYAQQQQVGVKGKNSKKPGNRFF
ncbi:uncharacterized protein BJ171DRAFT_308011 [Polychytrium aggregatum]|uniref:uncharacterized protein n=1 Tax=Polychytrium aggregatum TaxID=110093 RepID=UPI0022FF057B|nr:uncharacterized protein BJ171DRAFT_308011 [Polychytrium aggregatum]KAI9206873.1 hypothetical protein BJ171DRAFT_308011 [Polychytrium aggregatum]